VASLVSKPGFTRMLEPMTGSAHAADAPSTRLAATASARHARLYWSTDFWHLHVPSRLRGWGGTRPYCKLLCSQS